jgi:hypothetical protein
MVDYLFIIYFYFYFFPSNGGYYLLVRFGLWSFCFPWIDPIELDLLLVLQGLWCYCFFFFFSRQEVIGKRHRRVTGDSWRGFLFSPSTVEARSMFIRRSQHDTGLSMVFAWLLRFAASSHSLVGLQCLACGQHALGILSLGSHTCGPRSVFQVVTGGVRWFLAAAYCSGVPRDGAWSTRAVSNNGCLPWFRIYVLVFSVLVFWCFSVISCKSVY